MAEEARKPGKYRFQYQHNTMLPYKMAAVERSTN